MNTRCYSKSIYNLTTTEKNTFNQKSKPMYKQNLGFIAPFALNILAYVMIWHFCFRHTEPLPQTDSYPTPIVNIDNATEAPAKAFFIAGENYFSTTPSNENE